MTEPHPFKWRHFQPDIILLCVLVCALFPQPPRSRRTDARAGTAWGSSHHLPLGPVLCPGAVKALSASSESLQRFLESG